MNNKYILPFTISVLLITILGCSYYNPLQGSSNSNDKSLSEKTIDSTVGLDKVGIPECDELIEDLANQSKNTEDDFITKAGKEIILNKIRESLKQSIEENKADKTKLAKDCREYKQWLDKYKTEQNSNK
jgi:hypothetical protein